MLRPQFQAHDAGFRADIEKGRQIHVLSPEVGDKAQPHPITRSCAQRATGSDSRGSTDEATKKITPIQRRYVFSHC
jgi:hypothetical protein